MTRVRDLIGAAADGELSATADRPRQRARRMKRPLHLVVIGLLGLLIVYFAVLLLKSTEDARVLTVALACAAVGALLGFIFAIPKRTDIAVVRPDSEAPGGARVTEAQTVGAAANSAYRPNTSLEEISDWLTKIIVGLGLVEAGAIAAFVDRQGTAIAPILFGAGAPPITGGAMLVATTVLTFLAAFLYFRLYLAEEFTRSDNYALEEQRRFEEARQRGRTQQMAPKSVAESLRPTPPGVSDPIAPRGTGHETSDAEGQEPASPSTSREKLVEAIERKVSAILQSHNSADPSKGLFGGQSAVVTPGVRRLEARVQHDRGDRDWFRIQLLLWSASPRLKGEAAFFYHPTFATPYERVPIVDGKAQVELYAYGAFTVGVLADGGETELELDLAELPDAPAEFRER